MWGSAKLPYIISIDSRHPHRYDLKDVFALIAEAEHIIKSRDIAGSPALKKMLATLEEKRNDMVASVCHSFLNSIINFTEIEEYRKCYAQYILLAEDLQACKNVLNLEGVKSIIEENSKKMFNVILGKITVLKNVDLLNESNYLTFYDEIIE